MLLQKIVDLPHLRCNKDRTAVIWQVVAREDRLTRNKRQGPIQQEGDRIIQHLRATRPTTIRLSLVSAAKPSYTYQTAWQELSRAQIIRHSISHARPLLVTRHRLQPVLRATANLLLESQVKQILATTTTRKGLGKKALIKYLSTIVNSI